MEALQFAAEAVTLRLLHYDAEYEVLICKEHCYAIENLNVHLQDHEIHALIRRTVIEKCALQRIAMPQDVRQPLPFEPPFDMLGPPVDALLCAEPGCGFASTEPKTTRAHCKRVHNWRSTAQEKRHWTRVKAQTFFTSTYLQRYFAVLAPGETRAEPLDFTKGTYPEIMAELWKRDKRHKEERLKRENKTTKMAIQRVLGRADASFRSIEQEQALCAMFDRGAPLVVVSPTGGGKSMLFMAPACLRWQGISIAVMPSQARVNDLLASLKKARIPCLEWRPGETNAAAVVVVNAEMVSATGFMAYAVHWKVKQLVVDECHLVLTASPWRSKLAQLRELRQLDRVLNGTWLHYQTVLLTATLPPVLEQELGESLLMDTPIYIRASTARPNIRYTVSPCRKGQLVVAAVTMCQGRKLKRKAVVYCRSKMQCKTIADALGCGHYYTGVPDREEQLEAWLKTDGFIVATTGLGTGIDADGIEFVLHVDVPWGMIDFAQESGRAGQSGSGPADSIVLVEEHVLRDSAGNSGEASGQPGAADFVEEVDAEAMAAFMRTRECRRAAMSRYLDGKETRCADVQGAACDRCSEGPLEASN
jgi:hypothetical protein